jgi:hypothetical protein
MLCIVAYRPVAKHWICIQQLLLGNARNIHAHNNRRTVFSVVCAAAVSGQRLGIHVPASGYERNDRLTVFSMWFVPRCYNQDSWSNEFSRLLYGRLWRQDVSECSWRIFTVRSCCQGRAGEDTACWEMLSGCCGDLWIVHISSGAVIACSSVSCL